MVPLMNHVQQNGFLPYRTDLTLPKLWGIHRIGQFAFPPPPPPPTDIHCYRHIYFGKAVSSLEKRVVLVCAISRTQWCLHWHNNMLLNYCRKWPCAQTNLFRLKSYCVLLLFYRFFGLFMII